MTTYYIDCPHCDYGINDSDNERWFEGYGILTLGINKDTGKEVECPVCETKFLVTGFSD